VTPLVAYDYQIFGAQRFGGISRYFCSLASHLYSRGCTPRIIAPFYINEHLRHVPREIVSGRHVPQVRRTERALRGLNSFVSRMIAETVRPRIVHETYYAAGSPTRRSFPTTISVFDMIHELWPESFPAEEGTARNKRRAVECADRIICISENTRRDLLRLLPVDENKVFVTHLGFDRLDSAGRRAEDLVGERPYILYVGARNRYKNFRGLARALGDASSLTDNFRLVCFGGGALTPEELSFLGHLGLPESEVLHVGGGDDVLAALYIGAAVFVYPSLYEGFGIPPLEAMSLDCPVIASNTSSIPEVCGDAVEYCDPHDPNSIRSSIERVLGSVARRKDLVTLGRHRAKLFTWDRCAAETLAVYEGLLA
jgi:glycosyltransferase involved in cell wall biosynthesis